MNRCNICNLRLKTKTALISHLKSKVHIENDKKYYFNQLPFSDEEEKFKCEICKKDLKTKTALISHFKSKVHVGNDLFKELPF